MKKAIFIALCAIAVSCQSLDYVNERDANGLKTEYTVDKKTRKKEGYFRRYFESGSLMEEAQYKNNVLNGERKLFLDNGSLQSLENYSNGLYNGPYKAFFADGKLEQEGQYTANEMSGEWKTYYPGGQLKEIVTFANNLENGPFKEFYPSGVLKAEGNYRDGDKEEGELREYLENGSLHRIANCSSGRCTTTWRADTIPEKN